MIYEHKKFGWTLLAGIPLVHPSIGIWTALFSLFVLIQQVRTKKIKRSQISFYFISTTVPWLYIFFQYIYLRSISEKTIDPNYIQKTLTNWNFQAANIFDLEQSSWTLSMVSLGLLVSGLAFTIAQSRVKTSVEFFSVSTLLLSAVAGIGLSVHFIGILDAQIFLLRLFGSRVTMLLQAILFIALLIQLGKHHLKDQPLIHLMIVSLIVLPGVATTLVCYSIYFAIFQCQYISRRVKYVLGSLIFLGWALVLIPAARLFMAMGENFQPRSFLIASHLFANNLFIGDFSGVSKIILSTALILLLLKGFSFSKSKWAPAALMTFVLLVNGTFQATAARGNDEIRDFAKVQIWARDNTDVKSLFYLDQLQTNGYLGWRNLSERPLLQSEDTSSPYLYLKSDKEHAEAFKKFQIKSYDDLDTIIFKITSRYSLNYVVSTRFSSYEIVKDFGKFKIYKIKMEL
jgi:hypothetical protein